MNYLVTCLLLALAILFGPFFLQACSQDATVQKDEIEIIKDTVEIIEHNVEPRPDSNVG